MMSTCERVFPIAAEDEYIRCHLFFEAHTKHGLFNKKAMICKGRKAADFADREISVPKEFAGLLGLVRSTSFPLFSRIDLLQAKRKAEPTRPVLGLTVNDTRNIPDDLNFVFVVPIFDYRNITYETGELRRLSVPGCEDCVKLIDTGIEGPLIGAISIDGRSAAAMEDLDSLVKRVISNSMLESLERYAWEIGCIVAEQVVATIGKPSPDLTSTPIGLSTSTGLV
jgi:hypothetical protein